MSDDKDKAQAELAACGIRPGQVYRHYKGGLYTIVTLGIKEDTLEPMVAYHSNAKDTTWVRTLANFSEQIAHPYGYSKRIARFIRETD
jgi:hypothetical protein